MTFHAVTHDEWELARQLVATDDGDDEYLRNKIACCLGAARVKSMAIAADYMAKLLDVTKAEQRAAPSRDRSRYVALIAVLTIAERHLRDECTPVDVK